MSDDETTIGEQATDAAAHDVAPAKRPRGRPRRDPGAPPVALTGHTLKSYALMPDTTTVAQLRRILNQRGIPEAATVQFGADRLTLEWDEG